MRLATIKVNGRKSRYRIKSRYSSDQGAERRKGNCMGGRHDEPDPETADPGLNKMV